MQIYCAISQLTSLLLARNWGQPHLRPVAERPQLSHPVASETSQHPVPPFLSLCYTAPLLNFPNSSSLQGRAVNQIRGPVPLKNSKIEQQEIKIISWSNSWYPLPRPGEAACCDEGALAPFLPPALPLKSGWHQTTVEPGQGNREGDDCSGWSEG